MKSKGQNTHIIKDEERNRNKWKIGIEEGLISGREGTVRAAKLQAGKERSGGTILRWRKTGVCVRIIQS